MEKKSKIYIAGHSGLVGAAILRKLQKEGYENLITKSHAELDLTRQREVEDFFAQTQPEYIFLAAAKVGGIWANNTYRADFIYTNLMIQTNVIQSAYRFGAKKLLFLGSSCIYPRLAPQPLKEEYLLTGLLEPTNEPYALAKITGIKMCQAYNFQYKTRFISVMPTNLYGPYDNFDLNTSHVLPAWIRKFYEAKQKGLKHMTLWGSGKPRREFLHVDDLADALLFLMLHYEESEIINIGTGEDIALYDLAEIFRKLVDANITIEWDTSKPDGTPQKLLDISKIQKLGWRPTFLLQEGIAQTYDWFCEHYQSLSQK